MTMLQNVQPWMIWRWTPGYFMGKIEVTDMDENAKQLFSLGDADAKYFMWSIEDFFATG